MEAVLHNLLKSCAVLLGLLFAGVVAAQSVPSISINDPDLIRPSALDTQDLFGMDIVFDGNTAIVSSRPRLYFFNQDNNGRWQLQSTLDAESDSGGFGEIELQGNTLIASMRNHTAVYRKNNSGTWQLESDTLPASFFVEYDGVRLMLGRIRQGEEEEPSFTSIYSRNNDNSWTREFHVTGRSGNMDIEGNFAVVRADGNTYIYNRNSSGQWEGAGVLSVQDFPNGDVALHNGQLLIGYQGQDPENGFAYLYSRVGGGLWQIENVFRGRVEAGPGQELQESTGDRFGSRVEFSDNMVFIGALQGSYRAQSGLLYVFQRSGATDWQETYVLSSPTGNDGFPEATAYRNQSVLVGGILYGAESGALYAFEIAQTAMGNCDYSDADFFGGWGWNPVAGESCAPRDQIAANQSVVDQNMTDGNCDYSSADLFDGWGWDPVAEQSCAPRDQIVPNQGMVDQSAADQGAAGDNCDYSSADLFNGWGWDPVTQQSCAPLTGANSQPGSHPVSQPASQPNSQSDNCDYTDAPLHDGWGWDPIAFQSCAPR